MKTLAIEILRIFFSFLWIAFDLNYEAKNSFYFHRFWFCCKYSIRLKVYLLIPFIIHHNWCNCACGVRIWCQCANVIMEKVIAGAELLHRHDSGNYAHFGRSSRRLSKAPLKPWDHENFRPIIRADTLPRTSNNMLLNFSKAIGWVRVSNACIIIRYTHLIFIDIDMFFEW